MQKFGRKRVCESEWRVATTVYNECHRVWSVQFNVRRCAK